jgi:hypothetical protein
MVLLALVIIELADMQYIAQPPLASPNPHSVPVGSLTLRFTSRLLAPVIYKNSPYGTVFE